MYEITQEPSKHRFTVRFDLYADHDREKFFGDIQKAALNVRSADKRFDMIADFTDSMVMPQPIAKDSVRLTDWLIENGLRKSANIMVSVTQRLQVMRVTERNDKFGYFETLAEGERWLEN